MPLFLLHRPGGRSTLLVRSSSKKRYSQEYQRYAEVDRQTSVASADAPPGRSHPLQNEWEDRSDVELRLHPDDAVLDSPALRNRLASVVLVLSIVQAGVRRPCDPSFCHPSDLRRRRLWTKYRTSRTYSLCGSSLSSALAAAARWMGVICEETRPNTAASTAASSVKPSPGIMSGMRSKGRIK
jgi:hypothetical protein